MKNRYPYLVVGISLLLFCIFSFPDFFQNGFDGSFNNVRDGMKNQFTLISYVTEPIGPKGIFHFEFFQYPYGDYVYTADNTPLYAITMRWIHHNIVAVDHLVIPLFNVMMIANIIVCGLLLYYLCIRLYKQKYWAMALAIILPICIEQLTRIPRGIGNLSLSSIIVAAIILCYWYAKNINNTKKAFGISCLMFLLSILGFLIHGYYLPILCVVFFTFTFFAQLKTIDIPIKWLALMRPFVLVASIGLAAFAIMKFTDGYFSIRQTFAQGYDAADQKLALSYLYQSNNFSSINFPIRVNTYGNFAEPHMYMGHAFWTLLLIVFLASFFSTAFRRNLFKALHSIKTNTFLLCISIVAFFSLTISLGKSLYNQGIKLSGINIINFDTHHMSMQHYLTIILISLSGLAFVYFIISLLMNIKKGNLQFKKDKNQLYIIAGLFGILILFMFTNIVQKEYLSNRISPFYYIGKWTRIVEQFRSISRFAWPFLAISPILLVYIYLRSSIYLKPAIKVSVAVILLSLSSSQILDTGLFLKHYSNLPNIFSKKELAKVPFIPEKEKYAAIIPIPFFMVGSEDYNVTIDDADNFSRWLYQLSFKNKMPMMASKLSRTPVSFSDQMMDMLLEQKIKDPLLSALPNKELLVVVSRQEMYADSIGVINRVGYVEVRPKAAAANKAQFDFIKNKDLQYLYTKDDADFYAWKVK